MKILVIAAGFLFFAAQAQAQDTNGEGAVALVRAMRADVILLEASNAAISLATRDGYYTAAQFQCFQKLPASAFTADLAKILKHELSANEITEALVFYQSAAGVKFVDMIFVTLSAENGGMFTARPSDPKSTMSIEEMQAARDFSRTAVGKKLTDDRLLMTSPDSQAIARRVVGKQLTACGAKIPGA